MWTMHHNQSSVDVLLLQLEVSTAASINWRRALSGRRVGWSLGIKVMMSTVWRWYCLRVQRCEHKGLKSSCNDCVLHAVIHLTVRRRVGGVALSRVGGRSLLLLCLDLLFFLLWLFGSRWSPSRSSLSGRWNSSGWRLTFHLYHSIHNSKWYAQQANSNCCHRDANHQSTRDSIVCIMIKWIVSWIQITCIWTCLCEDTTTEGLAI